jgi:hypothetical protein
MSAFPRWAAEKNSKGHGLTRKYWLLTHIGLQARLKVASGSGVSWVYMTHVLTMKVLDEAPGRPGGRSVIANDPSLLKDLVGSENGTINDLVSHICSDIQGSRGLGVLGLYSGSRLGRLYVNHSHDAGLERLGACGARSGNATTRTRPIAHGRHSASILMLAGSRDVDVTNGGLELDQGVGLVVSVGGARLALSAEVHIVTNSALVAVANNVGIARAVVVVAQRAIAAYPDVSKSARDVANVGRLEWLIDRNEAVIGMDERSRLVAG